jgi:hypothetical protein
MFYGYGAVPFGVSFVIEDALSVYRACAKDVEGVEITEDVEIARKQVTAEVCRLFSERFPSCQVGKDFTLDFTRIKLEEPLGRALDS